jgi:membrane-associated phospholipid phosphatase
MNQSIYDKTKTRNESNNESYLSVIDYYDKKYSLKIHQLELRVNHEKFIYLMARIFNPDFITCYMIAIFMYKLKFLNDAFFVLKPIIHTVICLIITLILKKVTARPRPVNQKGVKRLYDLRQHEKNCSMPSGDSLQCANFCVILLFYFNIPFGFLILPLVMFSRIFYFCHYIMDTIAGSVLGILLSSYIYYQLN